MLAISLPDRRAAAGSADEARAYLDKATAAFALNYYATAAGNFEKAFELKPDLGSRGRVARPVRRQRSSPFAS
jgi:hypothetical protein